MLSKQRIIVQLTESKNSQKPRDATNCNVRAVDPTTLEFQVRGSGNHKPCMRRVQFDCVGHCHDNRIRTEFTSLVDQLLIGHQNCCLIRFLSTRECQLPFLHNLLIAELENRLQLLDAHVRSIKMEYFDIRKYDMVNMLQLVDVTNPRLHRLRLHGRGLFSNTPDLFKWLQIEYPKLWSSGSGQEFLDFQILFTDVQRRVHRVKFSLVQLYTSKMDMEMTSGLRIFLENLHGERQFDHSMLTDCLKEYFGHADKWNTWFHFDVMVADRSSSISDDMLTLANSAASGIRILRHLTDASVSLNSLEFQNLFDTNVDVPLEPSSSVILSALPSLTASTSNAPLPDKKHNKTNNKPANPAARVNAFSNKDLNNLSYWYSIMDEKFNNVIVYMDKHYENIYQTKILKICEDTKKSIHTLEEVTPQKVSTIPTSKSRVTLQATYNEYVDAINTFRKLSTEVNNTRFGELLKVYLRTKTFELSQHAFSCKEQQLTNCQSRLNEVFREELNSLQIMKQSTSQNDSLPSN